MSKKYKIIVAHPDDEVIFFISILKQASQVIVCFTNTQDKIVNLERIFINERIRDFVVLSSGKILVYTDGGNLILISRT